MAPTALLSFSMIQIDSPKKSFGLLSFSLSNRSHGSASMVARRGICRVEIERARHEISALLESTPRTKIPTLQYVCS